MTPDADLYEQPEAADEDTCRQSLYRLLSRKSFRERVQCPMNEILDSPSLALSPPCCVASRFFLEKAGSRSYGYAPSSRLA